MRNKGRIMRLVAVGTATILWATASPGDVHAKKPSGNGATSWSGAMAISGINQPDPTRGSQLNDVAVNASGLTIAAWDQFTYATGGPYTIGAAVQSGGRWGAPFTISGAVGFSLTPRVAVGADGTMAVSWTFQDPAIPNQQSVQVAVKPSSSAKWTTTTLASFTTGGVSITRPTPVAIDAGGNVTAAWNVWDGTRNVVQAATLPKGASSWSTVAQLSGTGTDALYLSLAVNAQGDAAVAFTLSPYSSYTSGTWAEYVFRSGPGGRWTSPVRVSETISSSVGYVTSPQVALDASGLATVIYMGYGLEAARQLQSGWTTGATVIPAPMFGASFLSPDLGLDAGGNAVVAVAIFDPTIGVDRSSVWVTRGTPAGVWTTARRITDPTVPVDAYATRVAVSPDGTLAMVGWIDHYHGTVQVSRLANGSWGSADTIGRGTAWSSSQEILGLDAASSTLARAIWKNAKTGTQTMAADYRP